MSSIWSGSFWKATAERAIATAAQSAIAYLGVEQLLNALTFDWVALGGIAAGGAILSVLKSLAANAATGTGPSFTNAEQTVRAPAGADDYGPGPDDLDPVDRDSR